MMVQVIWYLSLLYWLLALIIVYPPDEAVSAGLTVEAIFSSWLGSEMSNFINYQIKRTSVTIISHCLLLPGKLMFSSILEYLLFLLDRKAP